MIDKVTYPLAVKPELGTEREEVSVDLTPIVDLVVRFADQAMRDGVDPAQEMKSQHEQVLADGRLEFIEALANIRDMASEGAVSGINEGDPQTVGVNLAALKKRNFEIAKRALLVQRALHLANSEEATEKGRRLQSSALLYEAKPGAVKDFETTRDFLDSGLEELDSRSLEHSKRVAQKAARVMEYVLANDPSFIEFDNLVEESMGDLLSYAAVSRDFPTKPGYPNTPLGILTYFSGMFHDIGKKTDYVKEQITAPRRVNFEEFNKIKNHSLREGPGFIEEVAGQRDVKENDALNQFLRVAQVVSFLHHSEHLNTGYPLPVDLDDFGLDSSMLEVARKIASCVNVSDVVDAITDLGRVGYAGESYDKIDFANSELVIWNQLKYDPVFVKATLSMQAQGEKFLEKGFYSPFVCGIKSVEREPLDQSENEKNEIRINSLRRFLNQNLKLLDCVGRTVDGAELQEYLISDHQSVKDMLRYFGNRLTVEELATYLGTRTHDFDLYCSAYKTKVREHLTSCPFPLLEKIYLTIIDFVYKKDTEVFPKDWQDLPQESLGLFPLPKEVLVEIIAIIFYESDQSEPGSASVQQKMRNLESLITTKLHQTRESSGHINSAILEILDRLKMDDVCTCYTASKPEVVLKTDKRQLGCIVDSGKFSDVSGVEDPHITLKPDLDSDSELPTYRLVSSKEDKEIRFSPVFEDGQFKGIFDDSRRYELEEVRSRYLFAPKVFRECVYAVLADEVNDACVLAGKFYDGVTQQTEILESSLKYLTSKTLHEAHDLESLKICPEQLINTIESGKKEGTLFQKALIMMLRKEMPLDGSNSLEKISRNKFYIFDFMDHLVRSGFLENDEVSKIKAYYEEICS